MKVLDEALIHLDVDEAIAYMSKILLENGYVKEGYAERVIHREKDFPTGLIGTGRGIAIPHTTSDFANQPAICVLIPRRPIPFIMMGTTNQPVMAEIIFPLVVTNSADQLELLKKIMSLLKDNDMLDQLVACKNRADILALLRFLEE